MTKKAMPIYRYAIIFNGTEAQMKHTVGLLRMIGLKSETVKVISQESKVVDLEPVPKPIGDMPRFTEHTPGLMTINITGVPL